MKENMYRCPFFNTHHTPVGAFASLTFGAPGVGVSIDLQEPNVKKSGTLLVGTATEESIRSIGFAEQEKARKVELSAEGDKEKEPVKRNNPLEAFGLYGEEDIIRTLTPSKDVFAAENITFTVYTPYSALPDPENGPIPELSCLPGIVMDVMVDNSGSDKDSIAFFGLAYSDMKKVYAFEENGLCGIRFRDEWAFAAKSDTGSYLIRGLDAARMLKQNLHRIHQNGLACICLEIPAGERRTLTVTWSVYAKNSSNGALCTTYYYNRYFSNLMQVTEAAQKNAEALRNEAERLDRELLHDGQDPARTALFCQAVRAYYASSQLLADENGRVRWNIGEGAYLWRNTMDLCADHLAYELRRNPWVVRCLMDEFIEDYSYTDQVTFPGLSGSYPGGISFTHDMGCYFTYSKHGYSAYERVNDSPGGFYFYMTTEELLNGIYCIAGYALTTGDRRWLNRHRDILPQLMTSLENRDAPTPEKRNGILKASSARGGTCGLESTTYDALDHSLLEAAGNLYVFVKTWCSVILLKSCCELAGDAETAKRADKMLMLCRASAVLFESDEHPWLKANAYQEIPGAVSAAVEPLAIPHMLGAIKEVDEPVLYEILRRHSNACMQDDVCVDKLSGGLRLSSTSRNTWPSKAVLTVYVMETVLGIRVEKRVVDEIIGWAQVSAREVTIADQILCDTRSVVGALYYPRIVTAALWM